MLKNLYEDKFLIAVFKPAKMLTIATEKEKNHTLYHEVSTYLKKQNKANKVFIIHRLDYETSGIVLFAKNLQTKNELQANWDKVKRTYLAVTTGRVKKNHDIIKNYLKETRTLFTYVTKKGGKLALTEYTVLKRTQNHSLLEINLLTGRKNQIRVQLSNIGFPIVGDSKYGCEKNKYMLLHASKLEFIHPFNQQKIVIESELPSYFDFMDF